MKKYCSLLVLMALAGCEDPVVVGTPNQAANFNTPQTPQAPVPVEMEEPTEEPDAGEPTLSYADDDFVEADVGNRDPFRGFASMFRQRASNAVQRDVVMPNVTIDEMRLIAIISGVAQPRAMLQDPAGVGHVVKIGQYVGRAEIIQTGGADSMPVTLNWR
ncbi:MAG: hypothetical protein AAGE52_09685, partial [Myxococcota bacterium]